MWMGEEDSQHNGIHRFFISKNARVRYEEKHVGIGEGTGQRIINPQTYIEMAEDSYMEMDTVQIKGVDSTKRDTKAVLQSNAKLVIKEKIMTHGVQHAETYFTVDLDGEDSSADLVSRSVARGESTSTSARSSTATTAVPVTRSATRSSWSTVLSARCRS